MDKTDAKVIDYFPPLQLKGIRNIQVVRNRYLVVETCSQLAVYYIWDVVDGRDKYTGVMKEEADRIPKVQQLLPMDGVQNLSCLVQPPFDHN